MYYQEENPSLAQSARQNFVKKVYSIISLQLACTVAMVTLTFYSKAFSRFQQRNNWAFWTCLIGSIITMLALFLGNISRKVPINYAVISLFTFFESYMVSYVCQIYTPDSVLLAAVATLSATLGLTYYAMTTKQDMTSMRYAGKGVLSSLIWIVFSISLVNLLFLRSSFISMGIAAVFAVIYSIYLVVDTQLVLGGKNKSLQMDDYILGATIIYMDIISLFLKILRLLGKKKDD